MSKVIFIFFIFNNSKKNTGSHLTDRYVHNISNPANFPQKCSPSSKKL